MSYSDFVQTFSYGANLILDNLYSMANSLLSNYIFLTFLGISLAIPLFWFLYDFFFNEALHKEVDDLIDHYDRYESYKEFREIRKEFNSTHEVFNEEEAEKSLNARNEALRNINGGYLKYVVPQPVWLYQNPQSNPPSSSEKAEMDNIINNF